MDSYRPVLESGIFDTCNFFFSLISTVLQFLSLTDSYVKGRYSSRRSHQNRRRHGVPFYTLFKYIT